MYICHAMCLDYTCEIRSHNGISLCRSWLERQQNCPTCRNSVYAEARQPQAAADQAGRLQALVMRQMHVEQLRAEREGGPQQDGAPLAEVTRTAPRVLA